MIYLNEMLGEVCEVCDKLVETTELVRCIETHSEAEESLKLKLVDYYERVCNSLIELKSFLRQLKKQSKIK